MADANPSRPQNGDTSKPKKDKKLTEDTQAPKGATESVPVEDVQDIGEEIRKINREAQEAELVDARKRLKHIEETSQDSRINTKLMGASLGPALNEEIKIVDGKKCLVKQMANNVTVTTSLEVDPRAKDLPGSDGKR